ncbi:MAG: transporter, family, shikimate and dehydroshikimate transport protein [Microbacteriaceae bacterium]|jgi:MHS family shikimate/dehydroshikimate transporter-like MFS transporter|nr:transporter, family, shikimate and dehydroshikimate transport protein [Microbacteriaceae bacterium]
MMHESAVSTPTTISRAELRRVGWGSFIGTAIEWYDFFVFSAASALVFGPLFFPGASPIVGVLSAFAVFGTGFVARPFGAIFFGYLGDKIGRKKTLITTLLMMGAGTFIVGCLPTAGQIGILAPILLVVCRLLQGFATGGEWGGATLVAIEFAPDGKRGKYGTFPQLGNGTGIALSTAAFALASTLPQQQFITWGWRVPFFVSVALIVIGLIIRKQIGETPSFTKMQENNEIVKNPLVNLFRNDFKSVLRVIGIKLIEGVFAIICFTFVVAFATGQLHVDRTSVLIGSSIAAVLSVPAQYLFGSLSDRVGRRPVLIFGISFLIAFAFPFFWLIQTANPVLISLALIIGFCVGYSAMYSVHTSYFAEMFPPSTRYSALAVSTNIGSVISSGPASLIAGALVAAAGGSAWMVSIYIIVVAVISLLSAIFAPETAMSPLRGEGVKIEETELSAKSRVAQPAK